MAGDQLGFSLDIGSILATDTFHLHTVHLHNSPAPSSPAQLDIGSILATDTVHLCCWKTWTQCSILNTILKLNTQYLPLTPFTCTVGKTLTQCSKQYLSSMPNTCHWYLSPVQLEKLEQNVSQSERFESLMGWSKNQIGIELSYHFSIKNGVSTSKAHHTVKSSCQS